MSSLPAGLDQESARTHGWVADLEVQHRIRPCVLADARKGRLQRVLDDWLCQGARRVMAAGAPPLMGRLQERRSRRGNVAARGTALVDDRPERRDHLCQVFRRGQGLRGIIGGASPASTGFRVRCFVAENWVAFVFKALGAFRNAVQSGREKAGEIPARGIVLQPLMGEVGIFRAGADEIALADTVGYANPAQVKRIFSAVAAIFDKPIYAHFHDTRGLGLANVSAAVDAGITRFDASIGGLGGCPFAPGASGNIDTEDCAFLLESLGFDSGLDIDKLVALRARVAQWLPQERVGGMIAQAGLPKTFGRSAQAAE